MSNVYTSLKNKLMMPDILVIISLLFISHSVQAQVYKCENDMGEVNFSDEPCSKGETSSRLNWLNSAASPKKKKKSTSANVSPQLKKTAEKARKNNEAYVLLSLLTTTQLELETASLRSSYEGENTEAPELILPDGVIVDLLKVDYISLKSQYGKDGIKARFVMNDGYEEIKILKKPYPVISGEAKIGRFSKSLQDIKRIDFFNSKKLLKARGDKAGKKALVAKKPDKKQAAPKKNSSQTNSDVPIIELDLSDQVVANNGSKSKTVVKPEVKVVENKTPSKAQTKTSGIQISFVNDKKVMLKNKTLVSTKGEQKSRAQHFMINENNQIPYNAIKRIKIRPTANKSSLLVAIELKTKEIKMEVMLPPFTRITGKSQSGKFDHSLLEIKSISFH
ncbi:MAG: DUF4124 domain-containing protein [gamma proteobacterium symbiont of Lucinoma myriamae]|nr:DUF4124 domain-containing protein [gamma proteobacterium symbiont of Lucinoma myriamae]MCU7818288.1 DUF4124 domain-containing protein [gamma proteobacterium symbiont of Lucinoma myriamae]MCU7831863.1 DUF4124 domain-containing protein [gamma proteobacterium symbiont of Lucinoma myriamae]